MDHKLIEMIDIAKKAARIWEEKGDANWAARNYVQAVVSVLRVAVKERDAIAGVKFLDAQDTPGLLNCALEFSEILTEEMTAGKIPASAIGGNYHLLVMVHVAWLVGAEATASRFLGVANDHQVRGLSPDFWNEYAAALERMVHGKPYDPQSRQWKREKYWSPYLSLVSDLSYGRSTAASRTEIEAIFEKRNRDRRFSGDQYGIEGSGIEPACWDFRLVSLRAFSQRNNGIGTY